MAKGDPKKPEGKMSVSALFVYVHMRGRSWEENLQGSSLFWELEDNVQQREMQVW